MILKLGVQGGLVYFLLPSVLSSLFWSTGLAEMIKCGRPGYSSLCAISSIKKEEYYVGENITYSYKFSNTFTKDPRIRTCLINGTWSGRMPVCFKRINKRDFFNYSMNPIQFDGAGVNLSIDGDKNSCATASSESKTSWKMLLQKYMFINEIDVLWKSRIKAIVTVYVMSGHKTEECRGDISKNVSGMNHQHFNCHVLSDTVLIVLDKSERSRSTSAADELLLLCEVIPHAGLAPSCVSPDIPYKGTASSSRGSEQTTYTINCASNYELVGQEILHCQPDATWFPRPPTCKLITACDPLPDIANGVLRTNSTSINSTAWLECDDGFMPLGEDTTHCLPTGSWTSLSHRCIVIQCDEKPHIPHGRGILLEHSAFYGAKLQIICDRGYAATDSEPRQCLQDATWGNLNICVEINCGPLRMEVPHNGRWIPLNETILIRVLVCDTGYHIEGSPAVSLCLSNGSWSYTSAVCRRTPMNEAWNNDWSPNTVLMIAVAAGAGTAIFVLSLAMCGLLIKKRRHSATNTPVFHVGTTDCSLYNNGKEQIFYKTNTCEDVIELRSNPTNSKPRKEKSALPHIPVDTDPVYAQPFEAISAQTKIVPTNIAGDFYAAHIYAEPVDSQRPPSDPISVCNSVSETWLRNGTRKFGRKMSLPGHSNASEDLVAQSNQSHAEICKPMRYSSNTSSTSDTFEVRNMFTPRRPDTFTELINNSIYLDIKDRNFTSGDDLEQLQMIDNDIYQDDYFSHA